MRLALAGVLPLLGLAACNQPDARPYTLYRTSPWNQALRVHYASFDSTDPGLRGQPSANQESCEMTAKLLNDNMARLYPTSGAPARFWCELGRYKR